MTDLRAAVASQLPEGAFLRCDRGDALYVTNAPAKGWDGRLEGFWAHTEGAIAHIYPDKTTVEKCSFAPDRLAEELSRFRGVSDYVIPIFCACIKCVELPEEAVFERCDRMVRQAAARALRAGGGEGLYYCALALAEARRRLDEKKGGK